MELAIINGTYRDSQSKNSSRKLKKNAQKYRPGQPNWECTMWKFQNFSVTQILREINFGHFEAPKTAILAF